MCCHSVACGIHAAFLIAGWQIMRLPFALIRPSKMPKLRNSPMELTSGQKAARTRRLRKAGRKAAATRRRRAVGKKAAKTRMRRAAGRKGAATRTLRSARLAASSAESVAIIPDRFGTRRVGSRTYCCFLMASVSLFHRTCAVSRSNSNQKWLIL